MSNYQQLCLKPILTAKAHETLLADIKTYFVPKLAAYLECESKDVSFSATNPRSEPGQVTAEISVTVKLRDPESGEFYKELPFGSFICQRGATNKVGTLSFLTLTYSLDGNLSEPFGVRFHEVMQNFI